MTIAKRIYLGVIFSAAATVVGGFLYYLIQNIKTTP